MADRFTFTEIRHDILRKIHHAHVNNTFADANTEKKAKEKMRKILKEELEKMVIWSLNTLGDYKYGKGKEIK